MLALPVKCYVTTIVRLKNILFDNLIDYFVRLNKIMLA
jgi:hypothetical protein